MRKVGVACLWIRDADFRLRAQKIYVDGRIWIGSLLCFKCSSLLGTRSVNVNNLSTESMQSFRSLLTGLFGNRLSEWRVWLQCFVWERSVRHADVDNRLDPNYHSRARAGKLSLRYFMTRCDDCMICISCSEYFSFQMTRPMNILGIHLHHVQCSYMEMH